jgi:NAD(P)-dependent dehydrogenase (short-subunit alcohol dehydrogenase family)
MATTNLIALITGANRGLGFELARALARDYGFHVLLGSRSAEAGDAAAKKLQGEGLSVESIAISLTDDNLITAAAEEVKNKYGRLDILVNNAAISIDIKHPGPQRELFKETFDTNVYGHAAVTDAFIPLLEKSTLPRLVFLSSKLGSIADRLDEKSVYDPVGVFVYRTSKAALNMVAAQYARKYREKGWKVNVVCPGWVKTDMNDGNGAITTEEAMPNIVRLCTLGADGESGTWTDPYGPVPW